LVSPFSNPPAKVLDNVIAMKSAVIGSIMSNIDATYTTSASGPSSIEKVKVGLPNDIAIIKIVENMISKTGNL